MSRGSVEGLVDRMQSSIDRLRAGCLRTQGQEPTLRGPVSPEAIDAATNDLGRPIPAQLEAFYRVADGMEAYSYYLPPTDDLGESDREAKRHIHHWRPGGGFDDLIWGQLPHGPTLDIGTSDGGFLMIEESGPHDGHLTALDAKVEQGYHWLAPSLEALLEAWAIVAEAGLIFMSTSADGICSPDADDQIPAIEEALRGHPCGLPAVGIFPNRPDDLP